MPLVYQCCLGQAVVGLDQRVGKVAEDSMYEAKGLAPSSSGAADSSRITSGLRTSLIGFTAGPPLAT